MNTNFLRQSIFGFLGLASLTVVSTESPAIAETVVEKANSNQVDVEIPGAQEERNWENIQLQNPTPETFDSISEPNSVNQTSLQPLAAQALQEAQHISEKITLNNSPRGGIPIPGTVATSSAALTSKSLQQNPEQSDKKNLNLAQADIGLGKTTRPPSSYLGIGANIGLAGESAVGDGNFVVISKLGITRKISLRPSAVLADDAVFLVPITYDFSLLPSTDPFTEPLPIAPYIGAGAAIETGDGSETAFLLTGGVDVPLNSQFTANAAVNAAFFDDTDVGLMVGVGYNFRGL